jgi:predicted alpha/beta-hydrolase family hydrolase
VTTRFLFAHGAGAPSSSGWMLRYAGLLAELGQVRAFDYPYAKLDASGARARKAPDKLELLVTAHRGQLAELRAAAGPRDSLVLAGKSMGGRVGCHVALEEAVSGLICFGYPLRGQNGKLRDQVLLELRTPVLFVQGTRDALCPLPELEQVRQRMTAPSELFIVDGGDHSLEATKTALKAHGTTQSEVERAIQSVVRRFCEGLVSERQPDPQLRR